VKWLSLVIWLHITWLDILIQVVTYQFEEEVRLIALVSSWVIFKPTVAFRIMLSMVVRVEGVDKGEMGLMSEKDRVAGEWTSMPPLRRSTLPTKLPLCKGVGVWTSWCCVGLSNAADISWLLTSTASSDSSNSVVVCVSVAVVFTNDAVPCRKICRIITMTCQPLITLPHILVNGSRMSGTQNHLWIQYSSTCSILMVDFSCYAHSSTPLSWSFPISSTAFKVPLWEKYTHPL